MLRSPSPLSPVSTARTSAHCRLQLYSIYSSFNRLSSRNSIVCAVCSDTYHMNCLHPPLLKKPSRGFAWACASCSRAQDPDSGLSSSESEFDKTDQVLDKDDDSMRFRRELGHATNRFDKIAEDLQIKSTKTSIAAPSAVNNIEHQETEIQKSSNREYFESSSTEALFEGENISTMVENSECENRTDSNVEKVLDMQEIRRILGHEEASGSSDDAQIYSERGPEAKVENKFIPASDTIQSTLPILRLASSQSSPSTHPEEVIAASRNRPASPTASRKSASAKQKGARSRIPPESRRILEDEFMTNPYPSSRKMDIIAHQANLNVSKVRNWFTRARSAKDDKGLIISAAPSTLPFVKGESDAMSYHDQNFGGLVDQVGKTEAVVRDGASEREHAAMSFSGSKSRKPPTPQSWGPRLEDSALKEPLLSYDGEDEDDWEPSADDRRL